MFRFFPVRAGVAGGAKADQQDGCTLPVLTPMKNGAESNKKAGTFS